MCLKRCNKKDATRSTLSLPRQCHFPPPRLWLVSCRARCVRVEPEMNSFVSLSVIWTGDKKRNSETICVRPLKLLEQIKMDMSPSKDFQSLSAVTQILMFGIPPLLTGGVAFRPDQVQHALPWPVQETQGHFLNNKFWKKNSEIGKCNHTHVEMKQPKHTHEVYMCNEWMIYS